jgi:hypothetical protein
MKVIGYARTSPSGDEITLSEQKEQICSWVNDNGYELLEIGQDGEMVDVVEDKGVPGSDPFPLDRSGFSLVREHLMRHNADTVVATDKQVYSTSMAQRISMEVILYRIHEAMWGDPKEFDLVTVDGEDLDYSLPDDPHQAEEKLEDMISEFFTEIPVSQSQWTE